MLSVVGIGGHKVDHVQVQHTLDRPQALSAESAGVRLRSHLHQASARNPVVDILEFPAANRVSFGVGQNGRKAGKLNFIENIVHLFGNEMIVKLYQEVLSAVNTEGYPFLGEPVDIVVREVKITT